MLKKARRCIEFRPAKGLVDSWGLGFRAARPHRDYETGEVDGQSVDLVISRDSFTGYGEDGLSNFGETITVHHLGANERTYAGIEVGAPVEIEVESVSPRCSTFYDEGRNRHVGYISGLEFYGKVKKAAK